MKITDDPQISAEKALRVGMYYALRSYPGGSGEKGQDDLRLRSTMKDLLDGRRPSWGEGNNWITDVFAAVYQHLCLPHEWYELMKSKIFTL